MAIQLLDTEWKENVGGALKTWEKVSKLNTNPLTEMEIVSHQLKTSSYVDAPFGKALALREVMRDAIATLGVAGENPPVQDEPGWSKKSWLPYLILTLRQKCGPSVARDLLYMSESHYYRNQKEAIEMLVEVLRVREGVPAEAASPIALAYPSGAVKATDPNYIARRSDSELAEALTVSGETITIRGPRQVGKTSMLVRGMYEAQRQFGAQVVYFDLQEVGEEALGSLDDFLRVFADYIFDDLDLDPDIVQEAWESRLPAARKLTKLLERHVLKKVKKPVLLAMDEIDRLQLTPFHSDFFGLVRSWHNKRARDPLWDKLNIIMAISTEPYLLIADLNQSPFNVGHVLYLKDFDESQVVELNHRHKSILSEADITEVMNLLNGHPYLTRVTFYKMVVNKQSWSTFADKASSDQGPFHQHLQHQYRMVINDTSLRRALKEISHGIHCSDDAAGFRLMKAGLVDKRGDRYICRCELYRQYFAKKL